MGNGQSRDGFAGVLPSVGVTSTAKSEPVISDAWTADAEEGVANSGAKVAPVVGKIVPPSHALQQENSSHFSLEASEIVRAFNKMEERFMVPESVSKSRTLDAYADVCSEILPGLLFVSNLQVARDTTKLKDLGITHVINCCGELKLGEDGVELSESSEAEFDILKLLLRDDANEDLTPFLPQVMEYIDSCRQLNGKVLVHCHQGVSRSCAFAIAFVMLDRNLSYHEASAFVKRQRAVCSPNAAFICQLLEWEKDLKMMRSTASFALGGLYRLTLHSTYDPETFVLKRCYERSAGTVQQRQNVANVHTQEDERKLLWSQGTFVFQSSVTSTDVIVWLGCKCEIPDAAAKATKLASQLLRLQTLVQSTDAVPLQVKIVGVKENTEGHAGTEIDLFGYSAELEWRRRPKPPTPSLLLSDGSEPQSSTDDSVPQLFILEAIDEDGDDSWEQVTNYDSEDLTPDSAFLLFLMERSEGFVWIGTSCNFSVENVAKSAQKQLQEFYSKEDNSSLPSVVVEHQNQETDAFWELFEAGY